MRRLERKLIRENQIYILPSARGFIFLGLVAVMILTAATYNNNLIFILAFLLFAIFVVSMLQTHYNLKGVELRFAGADEAFEGEALSLLFQLAQKRARDKRSLRIRARGPRTLKGGYEDLRPGEKRRSVRVEVEAWRRGVHEIPQVVLETFYPLGLFRAWKIFRPEGRVTIYPRPEATKPLDSGIFEFGENEQGMRNTPDGDFGELKNYLPGESYHQIAWKHYARTGQLYSKVHWGSEHRHYRIPWPSYVRDSETRLRRMSAWIKQALDENASFEMELPDQAIEAGQGLEHARRCWRALALVAS